MRMLRLFGLVSGFWLALTVGAPAQTQPQTKVNTVPIVGTWALEVNAGEESYYLNLELKLTEAKLEGSLSEANGIFLNAPLTNVEFDGETLRFDVKVPTPPDGLERLIKAEAKLVEDKLQGAITVPDLSLSVPLFGVKK